MLLLRERIGKRESLPDGRFRDRLPLKKSDLRRSPGTPDFDILRSGEYQGDSFAGKERQEPGNLILANSIWYSCLENSESSEEKRIGDFFWPTKLGHP